MTGEFMTKYNAVRKREEYVFNALKQIVVIDENCQTDPVRVMFGGQDLIESYILDYANDGFYMQVADNIDDMNLPVIGITTNEIGSDFVKMRGTIYAAYREQVNQIAEQIYTTITDDPHIIAWPVKIGRRSINKCSVLTGEFEIQFTDQ